MTSYIYIDQSVCLACMLLQPPQTRHGIIVVFVYTSLSCVDTFRVVPQLGCLDSVPLLLQPPD